MGKDMKQLRRWLTLKACMATFLFLALVFLAFRIISVRPASARPDRSSRSEFPQPEVRTSRHGRLHTTLHARIADNKLVDQFSGDHRLVHTPTFERTIPAPTLSVKPGDTLSIDLVNDLPANPKVQRKGFFPNDPYTINLHTHGLEVSPLGISDNIFRRMEPGTTNHMHVDIPANHPSGTFWYHTHKHGAVTFQFLGGMAGFLIIKGGPGTLDAVPEVAAARDVVMGFQLIRTRTDGNVVFVHQTAQQFGTFPFPDAGPKDFEQGIWSTYGLDGEPGRSFFYYTTNGVTNPTLHMRPGEVQRWRLLNATDGDTLLVALERHGLNIVAMDGITVANTYHLKTGDPVVMGSGQRIDVLVKAGNPGKYKLLALDPGTRVSVSPSGIDPEPRPAQHSFDFPTPCSAIVGLGFPGSGHGLGHSHAASDERDPCDQPRQKLSYPFPLATIMVEGAPLNMKLPADSLPVPTGLPSVATMLKRKPDAVRHVAFEICGNKMGTSLEDPDFRLESCGWYYAKYDSKYWGGKPLNNLEMMRDADDMGVPSSPPDPNMPLVDFKKDGLFNPDKPLFDDMIVGNYEEWTVINRSFSDHPFHIHQNPFLVTSINNIPLSQPEWHDTIIVPASIPMPNGPTGIQPNIRDNKYGSITFRIHFDPQTVGCFVMHCHILSHEDIGMMQRVDVLPGRGQPSGCDPEKMEH
jgi:FtsP/CotA-like multicopper oxidase with cupredoxin domain